MPEETVGYVELEWTCANCGTVNPGLVKKCKNCGAAMSESQQFVVPQQAELLGDKEKLKATERGADIHCGYCGARNPADAVKCVNCGAELKAGTARQTGQVVGALRAAPAPAVDATVTPAATGKPMGAGMGIGCLLLIGLLILGGIVFAAMGARTTDTVGVVQNAQWQRTVAIMALQPVQEQAWRDEIPAGAPLGGCERRPRRMQDEPAPGADKICGTPYVVDQGSGTGKVVQQCRYQVYDDYCSYTAQAWQVVDRRVTQGTGLDVTWPALGVASGQRLGDRSESYQVTFMANDKTYTYSPNSAQEYARFQPGTKWVLKVNAFGNVTAVESAK